ncbi:MAG: LEA type 2 family protein [Candidatus Sericytochromatia bacterium]|nr:LEA type 2 family protein [Candidatus Sericytochromatia bacterium]
MKFLSRLLFCVLFLTPPALSGCAMYQAYAQRSAIRDAKFSIRNVQFLGLDLVGANLLLTLQVENPTSSAIEMDRLQYGLWVNGTRAFQGEVSQKLMVPSHQARPLPIHISLVYADLGTQLRQLLIEQRVKSWRVDGTAFFDTPFGSLEYPVRIERSEAP